MRAFVAMSSLDLEEFQILQELTKPIRDKLVEYECAMFRDDLVRRDHYTYGFSGGAAGEMYLNLYPDDCLVVIVRYESSGEGHTRDVFDPTDPNCIEKALKCIESWNWKVEWT